LMPTHKAQLLFEVERHVEVMVWRVLVDGRMRMREVSERP
jgi:hypothetical protein